MLISSIGDFCLSGRYDSGRSSGFANAIVYISKFAGQRPVARKLDERITTRDKNLVKGMKYTLSRKCWEEYCKTNDEYNQQMEEMKKETLAKKAKGEKLNQIEEISLIYQPMKNPSYAMFLKQREPEMYHFFGEETGLYVRYYEINYPYFMGKALIWQLTKMPVSWVYPITTSVCWIRLSVCWRKEKM